MSTRKSAFVKWMGPVLDALRELGGSGKPQEVLDLVAERHGRPDRTQEETLKSGQTRFYNQVHWARQYLVWGGLVDAATHGVWTLTPKGYETKLDTETASMLARKWARIRAAAKPPAEERENEETSLDDAPAAVDEDHRFLLLELLRKVTPEGFERISARLLRESGFEKVTVTGRSRDGGIDGIGVLQVNPFVSFKVLFQCKRYKGTVSRAEVGDFRNAMMGRAEKGIIITTGTFSSDALREADRDGALPIELVDGEKLVGMFERAKLGVRERTVYELDHAFFGAYLPADT